MTKKQILIMILVLAAIIIPVTTSWATLGYFVLALVSTWVGDFYYHLQINPYLKIALLLLVVGLTAWFLLML